MTRVAFWAGVRKTNNILHLKENFPINIHKSIFYRLKMKDAEGKLYGRPVKLPQNKVEAQLATVALIKYENQIPKIEFDFSEFPDFLDITEKLLND